VGDRDSDAVTQTETVQVGMCIEEPRHDRCPGEIDTARLSPGKWQQILRAAHRLNAPCADGDRLGLSRCGVKRQHLAGVQQQISRANERFDHAACPIIYSQSRISEWLPHHCSQPPLRAVSG
jgi:hypothetical protein